MLGIDIDNSLKINKLTIAYNKYITYLYNVIKKEVLNEMNYKERLIAQIFKHLAVIENEDNQPIIEKIRGLLRSLESLK